jgi:polysaccharide export outer membrane protein
MNTFRSAPSARALLALAAVLLLPACSNLSQSLRDGAAAAQSGGAFKSVQRAEVAPLLSKEDLALLEESVNPVYRIGSGDVVRLDVYGRPEVSGKHVVGPDGMITVPMIGNVFINDMTREAAVQALDERLRAYFTRPHPTLAVEEYTSNQVTVLGRVERAGVQKFTHPPTLAEVLANAGAMPILDKQATLTRTAIMRGREKLIWVDVKALLNGDPAYNIRMKKGDIVFIPDSSDTSVYVLGAVTKPGSYRLTPRMTVLDALAQAGGATENAEPTRIGVYRAGAKQVEIIDMGVLIDPARRVNYALEDGDVIFVPNSGLADFGYIMRQIAPAMSVLTFGLGLNNVFGL